MSNNNFSEVYLRRSMQHDKLTFDARFLTIAPELIIEVDLYIYSCSLSTATIEYSCPCVCVCVCVCVCESARVCVCFDNSKNNGSIHLKLEHIVVYEYSSNEFDIGHCPIKVKVTA